MKKLILFIVFFNILASVYSQKTIAVLNLRAKDNFSQRKADKLSKAFNACFIPKEYILMDRSQLVQELKNRGLQNATLTEKQKLKIGEALNLTAIVSGEVRMVDNMVRVEVWVSDVRSQKIIHTENTAFSWKNHKNAMCQFASHYMSPDNLKEKGKTNVGTDTKERNAKKEYDDENVESQSAEKTVTANRRQCKEKTVHDAEGNSYNTIQIGKQCWMSENMRATVGIDGKVLNYYVPNGKASNVPMYGYLYDWRSAKVVCPKGWHLPTKEEWDKLEQFVMSSGMGCGDDANKNIAKALASDSKWQSSTNACAVGNDMSFNDLSGFNAYPAGLHNDGHYSNFGYKANFWCAKEYDAFYAYSCNIGFDNACLGRYLDTKAYGFSVRCIHD